MTEHPDQTPGGADPPRRVEARREGDAVATAVKQVDSPLQPGRPVVLVPTPPGFWPLLLGVAVAALAPLFGFLWGGTLGPGSGDTDFNPIYLGLFFGIVVGALGVVLALWGGMRLYRHHHPAVARDGV
jgi:hypothetical protein